MPMVAFCRIISSTKERKLERVNLYTSMGTLMQKVVSAWLARMEFDEERAILFDDGCSA